MDSKTFTQNLSRLTGDDVQQTEKMLDALTSIIREAVTSQKIVAIPSFGSFEAVKQDEIVTTDLSTGKRMLLPPQITLNFSPAAMLRKNLNNHE